MISNAAREERTSRVSTKIIQQRPHRGDPPHGGGDDPERSQQ